MVLAYTISRFTFPAILIIVGLYIAANDARMDRDCGRRGDAIFDHIITGALIITGATLVVARY